MRGLVIILVFLYVLNYTNGATTPSQCKEERRVLVNACRAVITGSNPSARCCQLVRATHWECICPVVTPKLAALVNIPKTINQIKSCGKTVPHKFKCGSITTP